MGKTRHHPETGAGQHGVASATVARASASLRGLYGCEPTWERQAPNVFRMKLLGAEVKPGDRRQRHLKDAMNEALRDWVTTVDSTYY